MNLKMLGLLVVMACSMQVWAQEGVVAVKGNIVSNGTHFVESVKDKKWSNSNGDDFTRASFVEFSGSCYVNLEVKESATVDFHSLMEVKRGKIEVKLMDEDETVYFYCSTTEKCIVRKDVVLEKGKKYRLYFTGVDAKGKYLVKWD